MGSHSPMEPRGSSDGCSSQAAQLTWPAAVSPAEAAAGDTSFWAQVCSLLSLHTRAGQVLPQKASPVCHPHASTAPHARPPPWRPFPISWPFHSPEPHHCPCCHPAFSRKHPGCPASLAGNEAWSCSQGARSDRSARSPDPEQVQETTKLLGHGCVTVARLAARLPCNPGADRALTATCLQPGDRLRECCKCQPCTSHTSRGTSHAHRIQPFFDVWLPRAKELASAVLRVGGRLAL